MAHTLTEMHGRTSPINTPSYDREIAYHAERGEQWELVFEYAPRAAEEDSALYAYADAIQHLEAATRAYDRLAAIGKADEVATKKYIDLLMTRMDVMPQVGGDINTYRALLEGGR